MSLTTQFYTMIAMVGMGSWLGAALDTYGRFLKRPKRAHWVVFINDVLFWVLQGLIIFYTLLMVNEGELRFYVFIALLCGYATYQSLLKKGYLMVLEALIQFAIATYRFFAKAFQLLIIRPIQALIQFVIFLLLGLAKLLLFLGKLILKILHLILLIVYTPIKWIGLLLWKLVPNGVKNFLGKYFMRLAGIMEKVENIKLIIIKIWKKIRRS